MKAIKKRYPHAWVFKVVGNPYQMSGVPDLLVGLDGVLIALEVKHKKAGESAEHARGRTEDTQDIQIARLHAAGCWASVILTPAEALEHIEQALSTVLGSGGE